MTLKGGTSQACAACKYQRRKCTPECPLAPCFPADQPKKFMNAHKLFGVSNIIKILKKLEPHQKTAAMHSIICQANLRDMYPVYGCLGMIRQLQYEIWLIEEEIHAVYAQIEMYRQQQQQQQQISSFNEDGPSQLELGMSQLELGMAPPSNALSHFTHSSHHQNYDNAPDALPITQQQSYSVSSNNGYPTDYLESKDNLRNSLWVQNSFVVNSNTNPLALMQPQLVPSQALAIQQEVVQDYDEMHPFFDTIDDRQSYIDSKDPYESSSEESLKDTTQSMEHVAENELKSAAASFSLTSVN